MPEILAPAGSREALEAALKAGADAVYFGLDEGFNARARAHNFPVDGLAEVVEQIHAARARAYLTLNTLIFESELEAVERIIRAAAEAGVDALIVQDPAVCLLAREVCPELEVHASTQMTISSPEGAQLAKSWGVTRVVLPRELSLQEIEKFAGADAGVEMEVFIAGALCMSWSGQCLSSEAWGGRSANRGQCAQACRHPYELVVDGQVRPLGDQAYLLSPQDLGGYEAVQELVRLGVHTLKIEGRQKDADYVFHAVKAVRAWLDQVPEAVKAERLRNLQLAYSRGIGPGFFYGSDHQSLVEGRTPRHQGILLGKVEQVSAPRVSLRAHGDFTPEAGMGVVFRQPRLVDQDQEQGGPIFGVTRQKDHWVLQFGNPGPRLGRVHVGDEVWVTSSPEVTRQRQAKASLQRWPLRLRVSGEMGQPLKVEAEWDHGRVQALSDSALQAARSGGLDQDRLQEKLGGWGDSCFEAEKVDAAELPPGLFLPVSELKHLRQRLRDQLEPQLRALGKKATSPARLARRSVEPLHSGVVLEPVCRTPEQLEAVIAEGCPGVTLDWMELVGLNGAVARAREAGLQVGLATVRVQKPGEEGYDRRLRALNPDWVLARHWGAVTGFAQHRPGQVHGDFSLNVTNSLTASELIGLGLDTVTAAHDLDQIQLENLLANFPASRLAVTVHHHISTFHTEHCVYSHLLSNGRDYRDCGRPCEKHLVELEDRKHIRHPVIVDVGCRNTVFNGGAQSCVSLVPRLLQLGVLRFRVEFVRESFEQARTVLNAYRRVLEGSLEPSQARALIGAHEQFGVSLGTMAVLS
ncbi:U32 family peptidase [bacterium]|nr:U32 family peptidase [bacterium]